MWEHFINLLSCRKFFPWKAEIIPQKRKFVHFFWIFFRLNYEIYQFFLINWIFIWPKIGNYFQFLSEIFPTISLEKFTTHLYFKLSDYFRKNFRKNVYSVYMMSRQVILIEKLIFFFKNNIWRCEEIVKCFILLFIVL